MELLLVNHQVKSSRWIPDPEKLSVIVDNLGEKGTLIILYKENIDK